MNERVENPCYKNPHTHTHTKIVLLLIMFPTFDAQANFQHENCYSFSLHVIKFNFKFCIQMDENFRFSCQRCFNSITNLKPIIDAKRYRKFMKHWRFYRTIFENQPITVAITNTHTQTHIRWVQKCFDCLWNKNVCVFLMCLPLQSMLPEGWKPNISIYQL